MRRAQEEIVGFGALLVVLAIVGVVLLGMYLRQPVPPASTFPQAQSFLDALPALTSTCALSGDRLSSIHELLMQCITQPSKQCSDGTPLCDALNHTMTSLITEAFPVGSSIQGYRFTVSEADAPPAFTLSAGNCSTYRGDQRFLPRTHYALALYVCP